MGKKLVYHFVGYGEKAEKSPYSSAPSRPLGTICDLMNPTFGGVDCSCRSHALKQLAGTIDIHSDC